MKPDTPAPVEHRLVAPDHWDLSVLDFVPAGEPNAIVIAGHAMMVDRRTLFRANRPSLVGTLVDQGFRVLLPDLRGHGQSGPRAREGGKWSYDDLVKDTIVYIELAHRLDATLPVYLLGHSLFGHTSLAYLGQHPDTPVAGLIFLSVNLWIRPWTPPGPGWIARRAITEACSLLTTIHGYLPAARYGFGSNDESKTYWGQFRRWMLDDRWDSNAGIDYHAPLTNLRLPVLQIVSDGDRFGAPPAHSLAFTGPLAPQRTVLHLGDNCTHERLRGLAPGHMGVVTDRKSQPVWEMIGEWITGL